MLQGCWWRSIRVLQSSKSMWQIYLGSNLSQCILPFWGAQAVFFGPVHLTFFLGQYQMAQPKFTITWNIFRPLLLPFVIWSSDPVARSLHFTPNPCPLAKEVTLAFQLLLLPYCPFAFEDYRLRLRHLVSHYWIIIGTAVSSNLNTYW